MGAGASVDQGGFRAVRAEYDQGCPSAAAGEGVDPDVAQFRALKAKYEAALAPGEGPKHVVVVHGYILAGTGSNIYSVMVAKTLKQMGHAVTIVCQDREAGGYSYVDEHFVGTAAIPATPPSPGTLRVVVPDINDLLPVYVVDEYHGYTVKAIPDCTEEELETHISMTAAGLRKVLDQGNVARVITNHALMSPVIGKRACEGTGVPFDIKLHGSAMTFVLRDHPQFRKYTLEALAACDKIIAGTSFIVDFFRELFPEEAETHRAQLVIVPPGMDPSTFNLLESVEANLARFREAVGNFVAKTPGGRTRAVRSPAADTRDLHEGALVPLSNTYEQRAADGDLLDQFPALTANEPVLVYFGKFLHTKAVGELILVFMEVLRQRPAVRLLLVGFGSYRENIEGMLLAAREGDLEAFKTFARAGDFAEFTDEQAAALFRQLTPEEVQRITVTGMLEHGQLSALLPMCALSFMISKANEAFGMTSVESLAAGVFPMMHAHSGILDVLTAVRDVEPELEAAMRVEVRPGGKLGAADGAFLVDQLPGKILAALDLLYPNGFDDQTQRQAVARRARDIVEKQFAWTGICSRLLQPASAATAAP